MIWRRGASNLSQKVCCSGESHHILRYQRLNGKKRWIDDFCYCLFIDWLVGSIYLFVYVCVRVYV